MFSHNRYRWNIMSMSFLLSFSWDRCCGTFLSTPAFRFYRHCPSFTPASLLVGSTPGYSGRFLFFLEGKVIRPYCFSLPAPPRISLLCPYHGICGFFVVSAPGKLCIYACLYRSNAHRNLPTDVPPAHIRTTVTLTFAKPAVSLRRVRQRKEPVQMRTCL